METKQEGPVMKPLISLTKPEIEDIKRQAQQIMIDMDAAIADVKAKQTIIEEKFNNLLLAIKEISNEQDDNSQSMFKNTATQFESLAQTLVHEMEEHKQFITSNPEPVQQEEIIKHYKALSTLILVLKKHLKKVKKDFTVSFSQVNVFFENNLERVAYVKYRIMQMHKEQEAAKKS